MTNRQERRHPSSNGAQAEKPAVQIHIGVSDRGGAVQISEFAAGVLIALCNLVPLTGSSLKAQVAVAQGELEEALRTLGPSAEETHGPDDQPPTG